MEPSTTAVLTDVVPAAIERMAITLPAIAAAIRGLTGLMKTEVLGKVWLKMPWWAKPAVLLALTTAAAFVDALTGQVWYLALITALTGLGAAVISYEWQELFKKHMPASPAAPATPKA